jgi:hypothetical protein
VAAEAEVDEATEEEVLEAVDEDELDELLGGDDRRAGDLLHA